MNLHFPKITVFTKPCMQVLTCFLWSCFATLCRTLLSFLQRWFCCCHRWFCHCAMRPSADVGLDYMLPSSPLWMEDQLPLRVIDSNWLLELVPEFCGVDVLFSIWWRARTNSSLLESASLMLSSFSPWFPVFVPSLDILSIPLLVPCSPDGGHHCVPPWYVSRHIVVNSSR